MDQKARLSRVWIAGLAVCGAGTILLIGLPHRTPEPDSLVPKRNGPVRPAVDAAALSAICAVLSPPVGAKNLERAAMAERIFRTGPQAIHVLVALRCGEETLPESAIGTLSDPIDPHALELRDDVVHDALARFDAAQRLAVIRERAADAPIDIRLALSKVLAEVDHQDAVRTWLELTRGVEPIHWQRVYVCGPLEETLAELLVRRPQSVRDLRTSARDVDDGLLAIFARSAARVHSSITAEFVVDLLGRSSELDVEVLKAFMSVGHDGRLAVDEATLEAVRRKLEDSDPAVQRAAIDALGANADDGSLDELIDALESDEPLVAHAALQALSKVAGAQLGPDPALWKRWRDEEVAWRERSLAATLENLSSTEAGTVVGAMQELAAHPLARHAAAEAIAPLIESEDDAISLSARETLTVLASGRAVPALLVALANEDTARRERARDVLAHLTGFELGPDAAAWTEALSNVRL